MRRVLIAIAAFWATACSQDEPLTPTFHEAENPAQLSDWGIMATRDGALRIADEVTPYDLTSPLFSDYAQKLRTVWVPAGEAARYKTEGPFEFPVGAIITKTFYYEKDADGIVQQTTSIGLDENILNLDEIQLIETRLLIREAAGWRALPYVWRDDQSDADLNRIGAIIPMRLRRDDGRLEEFSYLVPNANQCAACHADNATTKEIRPIGLKARHLNKPSSFALNTNQLDHWGVIGLLKDAPHHAEIPANADWKDPSGSINDRARAYLDINCSHCHNPVGAADTSGLNLEPDAKGPALGLCKSPIAAGGGTGGRPFSISPGAPDASIMLFRMETTDPGAMMPELGRALAHEEGAETIRQWIIELNPALCSL